MNFTAVGLPEVGSDGHRDIWMKRIREVLMGQIKRL